jgi:hypothetical protein
MPNWNQNKLIITHRSDVLLEWLADPRGLSFERIKPLPALPDQQVNDWCCTHWGTKWDLTPEQARAAADELLACGETFFNTAWSPPIAAITELSRLFPESGFRLDYYEGGCWFAGSCVFDGGSYFDDQLEDDGEIKAFAQAVFDEEFNDDDDPTPTPTPTTTTMNKNELIEQLLYDLLAFGAESVEEYRKILDDIDAVADVTTGRTPREAVAAVIAAAGNTDQCIDAVAEMVRAEMYRGEFGYASELVTALDEQLTP